MNPGASVSLLWLVVLGSAPMAADPVVQGPALCVAQWSQATSSCGWQDRVQTKGVGRTATQARKHAVSRLRDVLTDLARAAMIDASGTPAEERAAQLAGCFRVPDAAMTVQCSESAGLTQDSLCLVHLPEDPCWDGGMDAVQGKGWQVAEEARQQTCAGVARQLEARSASRSEFLRCRARCELEVQVHCRGTG